MDEIRKSFRNVYSSQEKPPRWFDFVMADGETIIVHKDRNSTDSMTMIQFVDTFNAMCGEDILKLNR